MRTLLDLIQEYATLNEAKTVARGVLPPALESRWQELKRFYDLLMAQDGLARDPASRFNAIQIRDRVASRGRLRVETELEIVVVHEGSYHHARVSNLSRGGARLHGDESYTVEAELTLHMASISRRESALPTAGRVRWQRDLGKTNGSFRFHTGVQFCDLGALEEQNLDAFVVECLEAKLLCLGRESLDPDFLRREGLAL